jgi:Ca2+ transporting ATPase
MSGEEFRKTVGGMRKSLDSEGNYKMEIQNKKEFQQIANRLRVLGRSIPYDKHLLVVGLRELGKTVAVTGEGINDVDALRAADVGFAMGSGVSIAKDAADMILTNDNFEATMNAVMWGRNIYSNVKKFIQFQVTVNLAALAIVFLSAVFRGESVLNSVQLLWINLIMDTFAALALATERPHPSIIKTPPVRKGEQIMTPVIWRQIYGMSAYMIIVMMILMFFGEYMWDISYNKADDFYTEQKIGDDEVKVGTNKCIHYTILFHTFVFL